MNYLSICSGIEAATQAWHPLGWQPLAFAEIEPFPAAVLAHRHPTVPNNRVLSIDTAFAKPCDTLPKFQSLEHLYTAECRIGEPSSHN